MNPDDWLLSLQQPAGSKRTSLSSAEEDREAKRFCEQPRVGNTERNNLDEFLSPSYTNSTFPSQDANGDYDSGNLAPLNNDSASQFGGLKTDLTVNDMFHEMQQGPQMWPTTYDSLPYTNEELPPLNIGPTEPLDGPPLDLLQNTKIWPGHPPNRGPTDMWTLPSFGPA